MIQTLINGNIHITGPYEVSEWTNLRLTKRVNEHAAIYLEGLLPAEQFASYDYAAHSGETIKVVQLEDGQSLRCLFQGMVTQLAVEKRGQVFTLKVWGISYTYLLDQVPRSRSFQNRHMRYSGLVAAVLQGYDGSQFNMPINDKELGELVVQYEETDWKFLKRMASRLQEGLVADASGSGPRLWFGLPSIETSVKLGTINYTVIRQTAGQGSLAWEVEARSAAEIGDRVAFQGKPLLVTELTAAMKQGELIYSYLLKPLEERSFGLLENEVLSGASITGTVIDRAGERVKLHLEIDAVQEKEQACWFSYSTLHTAGGGIGWHCMPELGDTVQLYFPSRREDSAVVSHSYRRTRAWSDRDPERKVFAAASQTELQFAEHSVSLGLEEGTTYLRLDEQKGVEIVSRRNITLGADADVVLYGKQVRLKAENEIIGVSRRQAVRMAGTSRDIQAQGTVVRLLPLSRAEREAFLALQEEVKAGAGYPPWMQALLLQYKQAYHQAQLEGDLKAMQTAEQGANELREKLKELKTLPEWAEQQISHWTNQSVQANSGGRKEDADYYIGLADSVRNKVRYIEDIRSRTADSYLDANRMEELSAEYWEWKQTGDSQEARQRMQEIAKEADAIREKYGINED